MAKKAQVPLLRKLVNEANRPKKKADEEVEARIVDENDAILIPKTTNVAPENIEAATTIAGAEIDLFLNLIYHFYRIIYVWKTILGKNRNSQ